MEKILYIVHCVDTEGPLWEPIECLFERIYNVYGLKFKPSLNKLNELQSGIGVPFKIRSGVMEFLRPERINAYNKDWAQIFKMNETLMNKKWRSKLKDDYNSPYLFNWFILDHIGNNINPRFRTQGYNAIFEIYLRLLNNYNIKNDKVYWHFHPPSFFNEANKSSNNFSFHNYHLEVLSRRIIDHLYFPSCFRPGMHVERPDINLFLELWIPFDYGNQGVDKQILLKNSQQLDITAGRFGDWRRAKNTWGYYHPDFYDYQKPGLMKRYLIRSLNLNSRINSITESEIEKAFNQTKKEGSTILAVVSHDERNMIPDVIWFYDKLKKIKNKYPTVKIKYSNCVDAIRKIANLKIEKPVKFNIKFNNNKIEIKSNKKLWGPQPFFCFKTLGKQYFWENLDFQGENYWSFTFDYETAYLEQLEYIGIATNDDFGNTTVVKINAKTKKTETRFYK